MRPQGARHYLANEASTPYRVSIHAPTGGATTIRQKNCSTGMSFNSRARRGRDPMWRCMASKASAFQFTRPQGARQIVVRQKIERIGFNSRARRGRDRRETSRAKTVYSFNSRAHKGRDKATLSALQRQTGFNSRAHKGRDTSSCFKSCCYASFNSRAHKGRDISLL